MVLLFWLESLMDNNHYSRQGKEETFGVSWHRFFIIILGVQLLPSILIFFVVWPYIFQVSVQQELEDVGASVIQSLEEEEKYLEQLHHVLQREELADSYTQMCLLLPCRVLEANQSQKRKLEAKVSSINLQISLDIYDIPIALELMQRVYPSIQLKQLEVHHYESTKLLLRYEQHLPEFQDEEWLDEFILLTQSTKLLEQAEVVHSWKEFYLIEEERGLGESLKLQILAEELPNQLIKLRKQRGVLLYKDDKGVSLLPLQR
jgi:hypothetical protein